MEVFHNNRGEKNKTIPRIVGTCRTGGKALQLRFYANINNDEIILGKDNKTLVYRTLECHVQTARKRKQMEYHPCKSVGIIEYSGFAKTIDERITCECLSCYPDITDNSCCCAWQFTLNE